MSQTYINRVFSAGALEKYAPLKAVYIYIGTATFDEIERDVKVKKFYIQNDNEDMYHTC